MNAGDIRLDLILGLLPFFFHFFYIYLFFHVSFCHLCRHQNLIAGAFPPWGSAGFLPVGRGLEMVQIFTSSLTTRCLCNYEILIRRGLAVGCRWCVEGHLLPDFGLESF